MKFLLVAVNAKYIHSNPAVYDLKAYAEACLLKRSIPSPTNSRATLHNNSTDVPENIFCSSEKASDIYAANAFSNSAEESEDEFCNLEKASKNEFRNSSSDKRLNIEIAEYTINNRVETCLADIYKRKPDIVAFSCYIWNWVFIKSILTDIKKILPNIIIWLGGPEVSYDAEKILGDFPGVDGIIIGEGEKTFAELCSFYSSLYDCTNISFNDICSRLSGCGNSVAANCNGQNIFSSREALSSVCQKEIIFNPDIRKTALESGVYQLLNDIPGLCIRKNGKPFFTGPQAPVNLDYIPFWYGNLDAFKNRIIYYESSRGCPFGCSYCLSSIDKAVRYRSMELVKEELQFFLDKKVPQVKFVDRTFNCNHSRTEEIWEYITSHDNGLTNFHFEIAADLITEHEIELLSKMRPGLVQLEIGVQSTNAKTLNAVHRKADISLLKNIVSRIRQPENVHIHLDLIAGLPYEDFESFKSSFNDVFLMNPDQLQLGFLKVLKGSPIEAETAEYEIKCTAEPPYEVLSTKWLSYSGILKLKAVEEVLEIFYNSGQFNNTIRFLLKSFGSPFNLFENLADFFEKNGFNINTPSRIDRFNILMDFAVKADPAKEDIYKELLTYDAYLRENCKSRPGFAHDLGEYNNIIFPIQKGRRVHVDLFKYSVWKMDVCRLPNPVFVEFDYENRSPLDNNCKTKLLSIFGQDFG